MKSKNLLFLLFVLGLLVVMGLQTYNVVYSVDESFSRQVENHLVSTVQIKGERINDYFLERKHDALVLADSVEVKELLIGEVGSNEVTIGANIESGLEVIVKQIEIYVNKYPDTSFSDWQNDNEFQKITKRNVGKTGYTSLVDYDNFDMMTFDYYKSANVKTGNGVSLGVAVKFDFSEFKILRNVSFDLVNSLERFKEISGYENLILIDGDGYVVHEVDGGIELGTNLNFPAYVNTSLGKAYFEAKESEGVVIYGPYLDIGEDELVLLFVAQVYYEGDLIGFIALEDSMDDVNGISTELTGLGETGDSYVIDKDNFLITPLRNRDVNLLVQEVYTDNSQKCFNRSEELISYFKDFKGDNVIGSYASIPEVTWCLVAEIDEGEVFEVPRKGKVKWDLFFVFGMNIILLIIGLVLIKKFRGKKK